MEERVPQIVAFGGGGFSMEAGNPLLDDYVLSLTGEERPRVCFLPTASGDADHYIVRFYQHFGAKTQASHISLFRRERGCRLDPVAHLLEQDLIYVGGGSVISMLGVWRAHRLDTVLREAWRRGIVLCGLSAGSLCWFSEGLSAFHGEPSAIEGLGLLPWSNAVHYDGEPTRRADYHAALRDGMCPGYAASDGAALHFQGTELARVVGSRRGAKAFRVECDKDGEVVETKLAVRRLGTPAVASVAA
jgi:dipeptidase E